MASTAKDALRIAQEASAKAAQKAAPAQSDNYDTLYGPVETVGGHADASLVRNKNTGVEYVEHRPRGGGRTKRVPLIAVTALFPQILPSQE